MTAPQSEFAELRAVLERIKRVSMRDDMSLEGRNAVIKDLAHSALVAAETPAQKDGA